jgi:hypothetical protein
LDLVVHAVLYGPLYRMTSSPDPSRRKREEKEEKIKDEVG